MPLPYEYNALQPYIDAETLQIHHDRLLKGYVDKLNATLEPYPAYHDWTLERLLMNLRRLPPQLQEPVRRYAGGVYNHQLYFNLMSPTPKPPSGVLKELIDRQFGGMDKFKEEFSKSAADVFGSGYTWLAIDPRNRLRILQTANQDNPLSHNLCPIITIDVWEHSYFLQYKNLRADYIAAWFNLLDWDKAQEALDKCRMGY